MTPDQLFQLANPLALLGWLVLLVSPLAPRAAQAISAGHAVASGQFDGPHPFWDADGRLID